MNQQPRSERHSQNRVVELFIQTLGYIYLGNWEKRANNRPIETALLKTNLQKRGYTDAQISAALLQLEAAADTTGTTLYQANMRTYHLLRYPIRVKTSVNKPYEDVNIIDWNNPVNNDFGIAEEVTIKGGHQRRPDIVLYINGIAIGVIELKRSSVEINDGIRQLITNQEPIFNEKFFSTMQLLFAGNDSQGLRYGTTGTSEQFFVDWKDQDKKRSTQPGELLDRPLTQLCNKVTILDIIRNCVIFDAGQKKVPRQHQYQGIKVAQERIRQREGGVIWHTQGSGKSILMVLLAKWIMEHDPDARILIITDRDELDKQIEGVMRNASVIPEDAASPRITSRARLLEAIAASTPRLLCALVHKFNTTNLTGDLPPVSGKFYVFVDECHRTQGGDMNKQMKRWMQHAIFIGFTGTPLLRKDKQTTRDVFGTNIHTYKFHEAVADGVVLDLKYEARNVPQQLTSRVAIDRWFEAKTKHLNNFQKAVVRKAWANMEKLMSAGERKQRIIASIIEDFTLRNRLNNNRGTAILVAASIYDACHYYRLFQNTDFGRFTAIVTSYEPNHNSISREPANSDERYKYDTYTQYVLLKHGQTTGKYEEEIKRRFKDEPANCKLLIVVSKLLTGFDAPSCSYIYLDNELRDHNLFQAICRTNRLDGEDKDFGYIVDFKELFSDVQQAVAVYTSDELDLEDGGEKENNVELKHWLVLGREKLDAAREALTYLCEPVNRPREVEQFFDYFCGDALNPLSLSETEPLRISFYKAVVTFVRAYSAISQYMEEAGYSDTEMADIEKEIVFYSDVRLAIKRYSGEELDIKPYEADMRHLMNTYIKADPADPLGTVDQYSLIDLIIRTGIHNAIAQKLNQKGKLSRNAIAEGIVNNIRQTIIREQLTDPRYYEEMSVLLNDLILRKREDTEDYEAFLRKAEELVTKMSRGQSADNIPVKLQGKQEAIVIFNNLPGILAENTDDNMAAQSGPTYRESLVKLALEIDLIMRESAPAGWRGDETREKQVLNALYPVMNRHRNVTKALFELLKNMKGYE